MPSGLDDEIEREIAQQRAAAKAAEARSDGRRIAREGAFAQVEPVLQALFSDAARRLSSAPVVDLYGEVKVQRSREVDGWEERGLLRRRFRVKRTVTETVKDLQIVDQGWPVTSLQSRGVEVSGSVERPSYKHRDGHRLVLVITTDGAPAIVCQSIIGPWENQQQPSTSPGSYPYSRNAEELAPHVAHPITLGEVVGRIEAPVSNALGTYFHLGELYETQVVSRSVYHPHSASSRSVLRHRKCTIYDIPDLLRPHLARTVIALLT